MSERYIFFIGTLCNGGAERVVSVLASQMARQGMDVEVLTYYEKPVFYELDAKVTVTAVEKMTGKTNRLYNIFWIRNYFKKNAKAVISFLAPFNIIAITANFGTGIPLIAADRNDPTKVPFNKVLRKVRDFLYRFASRVVLQTEKNRSYFSPYIQNKSAVIYNPINLGSFAGTALGSEKEKKIVTAGRLMPQKNQKMMIRAFAEISERFPDYQLIIYGEGPARTELELLIKELELQKRVFLPGNVSDLHERMKNTELFVMSSDYEGMPNALIEAMCLGLPVISTKVSGAVDLIRDHENGLLTETGDQKQLEMAMSELIENPELRERLARSAVELNEKLNISVICEQWIQLIEQCVTERK